METRDFQQRFEQADPSALVKPIAIVVIAFVVLFSVVKSYYTVEANQEAVVLRFGKFHTTAPPGLHFCVPLVDEVLKVSVEEHSLRLPVGYAGERSDRSREEDTLMLTGDLNAASVEWTVQWKVDDPEQYLFSFYQEGDDRYVERVILMAARTVMNRLVGDYSIDEILTEKRTEIAEAARQATQATLNEYECGVAITDLQMQRVTPPDKVKPAFAAVNSAVQQRDKLENEALKLRNEMIPKANAERDKKIQEAKGYAERRRAEVNGEITALMAKYEAYTKAPDVTRRRLYLEAMKKVLAGVEQKIVIDSALDQVLPLLPLNQEGDK